MSFAHLHNHSSYSILDGLADVKKLAERAKELGQPAIALTDHGWMSGLPEFFDACNDNDVKAILGSEVYVSEGAMDNKGKNYHLTLLAMNNVGYGNLAWLTTQAHLKGFYRKPRIDKDLLAQYNEDLICLSGCAASELSVAIRNADDAKALALIDYYQQTFGDRFYLEVMDHGLEFDEALKTETYSLAKRFHIPTVATNDAHYVNAADYKAHDILLCVQYKDVLSNPERVTYGTGDFYLKSSDEMRKLFPGDVLQRSLEIADRCNATIPYGRLPLPHPPLPQGISPEEQLKRLTWNGLKQKYGAINESAIERAHYELGIIITAGYAPYFLIVADILRHAHEEGIAYGVRGSVGGSLVAYCLDITELDPLRFGLPFERFLNPERAASMPDCDCDFSDVYKNAIYSYIQGSYGTANVSKILAFGTMGAKMTIRDVSRAMEIPYSVADELAKLIPDKSENPSQQVTLDEALNRVDELCQRYENDPATKRIIDAAKQLEKIKRQVTTHPAGVVVTADPITNTIPLYTAPRMNGDVVTQYTMEPVEHLGALKIDVLGLRTLTIMQTCGEMVGLPYRDIPYDDDSIWPLLASGRTHFIFQVGESCLSGRTLIGGRKIEKLYEAQEKGKPLIERTTSYYLDEGKARRNRIIKVVKTGIKPVYRLRSSSGRFIEATEDHFFMTQEGWKKLGDIRPNQDRVLVDQKISSLWYRTCIDCGKQIDPRSSSVRCYSCSARFHCNPSKSQEQISRGVRRSFDSGREPNRCFGRVPWNKGLNKQSSRKLKDIGRNISWECPVIPNRSSWEAVESIDFKGDEMTYDIKMESPGNNFLANGFMVHNSGMRNLFKNDKPQSMEEVAVLIALYRPGPMVFLDSYVKRHRGEEPATYMHPLMESSTKETFGIPVYQEQIMRLLQDVAGFTGARADTVRRGMGKKKKELVDAAKQEFIEGALVRGNDEKVANELWEVIAPHSGYSFNSSHAMAYAIMACRTAYLKANYPREFMIAVLNAESGNLETVGEALNDCRRQHILLAGPDINRSEAGFTLEGETVRYGLGALKEVGWGAAEAFVAERVKNGLYSSVWDVVRRLPTTVANKRTLDSLIKAGALDELGERNELLSNLENVLKTSGKGKKKTSKNQLYLFEVDDVPYQELRPTASATRTERLAMEKEVCGTYVSENALQRIEDYQQSHRIIPIADAAVPDSRVELCGAVMDVRAIYDKKGKPMAFMTLADMSGSIDCTVFSRTFERVRSLLKADAFVVIEGKLQLRNDELQLLVDGVTELQDEQKQAISDVSLTLRLSYTPTGNRAQDNDVFKGVCHTLSAHPGPDAAEFWIDDERQFPLPEGSSKVTVDSRLADALELAIPQVRKRVV